MGANGQYIKIPLVILMLNVYLDEATNAACRAIIDSEIGQWKLLLGFCFLNQNIFRQLALAGQQENTEILNTNGTIHQIESISWTEV